MKANAVNFVFLEEWYFVWSRLCFWHKLCTLVLEYLIFQKIKMSSTQSLDAALYSWISLLTTGSTKINMFISAIVPKPRTFYRLAISVLPQTKMSKFRIYVCVFTRAKYRTLVLTNKTDYTPPLIKNWVQGWDPHAPTTLVHASTKCSTGHLIITVNFVIKYWSCDWVLMLYSFCIFCIL